MENAAIMKEAQKKFWEALTINIPITQKFTAIPKFCSFFSLAFNLFSSTKLLERTTQLLHNTVYDEIIPENCKQIPLTKQQVFETHTIHQTNIPELLDSLVTSTFCQNAASTKTSPYIIVKTLHA